MTAEKEPAYASGAMRSIDTCGVLGDAIAGADHVLNKELRTVSARQTLYRAGERTDKVAVVSDGWAFRYNILSDGRRQILSFVLPGDLIAAQIVFRPSLACSVQMLTPARVCLIDRDEITSHLQSNPAAMDYFVSLCIGETEGGYDILADLGRRRAEERIARLILRLRNRLAARNLVKDDAFLFPLRQQHIADAVGLTPIHVNRVLGLFRRTGQIELAKQTLRILDAQGMATIADMNGEHPSFDRSQAGNVAA